MAYTERYVSVAGAGAHDGTSEANAFTWAEMMTDVATPRAGYRYNVIKGSYSSSTAETFTTGAVATPNCIRGYNSTIGDLDALRDDCAAADIVTTNFPVMTYSGTGNLTLGAYSVLQNVKIVAALNGNTVVCGTQSQLIHCVIDNTNASGGSVKCVEIGTSYSSAIDCDFTYDSTSNGAMGVGLDRGNITACRFILPATTGLGVETGLVSSVYRCAFIGGLRPVQTNGNTAMVDGCSFNDFAGSCIRNAVGQVVVKNCVAYSAAAGSAWFENVTAAKAHVQIHNAVSAVNADSNEGDYPVIGEISLSGDPFTSSTDLTLDASGITDCGDAAIGANLDIGAAQQAGGGGGSGGCAILEGTILRG